jgi:hypothetical protein
MSDFGVLLGEIDTFVKTHDFFFTEIEKYYFGMRKQSAVLGGEWVEIDENKWICGFAGGFIS